MSSESELKKRKAFDDAIRTLHGNSMSLLDKPDVPDDSEMSDYMTDEDGEHDEVIMIPEEDPVDATGKAVFEKPFTDMLIHAEVLLPSSRGEFEIC